MKIIFDRLYKIPINVFAEEHGLTLTIRQISSTKFVARFEDVETLEGRILASEYGSGSTPLGAVVNYVATICNKTLVKNAYTDKRKEFYAPMLDCSVLYNDKEKGVHVAS